MVKVVITKSTARISNDHEVVVRIAKNRNYDASQYRQHSANQAQCQRPEDDAL